jgi:hypothetical protein
MLSDRRKAELTNHNFSEAMAANSRSPNSGIREDYALASQDTICNFFVANMKKESPDWIIEQFDCLFIDPRKAVAPKVHHALYAIVSLNKEEIFRNTVNRCCYILINNWNASRDSHSIEKILQLFQKIPKIKPINCPTRQRLRDWIQNFFRSEDYQEINSFAAKYLKGGKVHWSNHYACYLLTSQSLDSQTPQEQREAAKLVARELKKQFKFDLAMYTARSQVSENSVGSCPNPIFLGGDVLNLIKKILVKRGLFSQVNLANIFLKQIEGFVYKKIKKGLLKYLLFDLNRNVFIEKLELQLSDYLTSLYRKHDEEVVNPELLLRTCNRVIDYLTTREQGKPSYLFAFLVLQGKSLTLAIILLKIILISRNSYSHLENCLADLIQYYEGESESNCQWLIKFLDTLRLTLAVYVENTRYELVRVDADGSKTPAREDLNAYWIFSQAKRSRHNPAP